MTCIALHLTKSIRSFISDKTPENVNYKINSNIKWKKDDI